MGRGTAEHATGHATRCWLHAAVLAVAVGLLVAGSPSTAMAQSVTEVPLWPDYPADLPPIAAQGLDREDDAEATGADGTDAPAQDADDDTMPVPTVDAPAGDGAAGFGVVMWIGGGILVMAAAVGGMVLGRRRSDGGGDGSGGT